jgi:hypothetical protein
MLISVFTSVCSLYSLMKRIWKDAHEITRGSAGLGADSQNEGGEDIEFQEFLSNFAEKD